MKLLYNNENKMEIGIILHWGLYSFYGFDDIKSLRKRHLKNGSEWFLERLNETGNYRPVSGYQETQKYFEREFVGKNYFDAEEYFNSSTKNWNPDEWFKVFKSLNIDYVILTAKHHDGFCLFETKTTTHKSERDLVKLFIDSGRKYGIRVGIYYSLMEFDKNVTKEYLNNILIPQIDELRNYKPDIWWFDGNWKFKTKISQKVMEDISNNLKRDNPKVLINDRILGGNYKNYSDRYIPKNEEVLEDNWESINTIGLSWGYCKTQEEKDYKTGEELQSLYKQVKDNKGRFLLNLGPQVNGSFDTHEFSSLCNFINLK